MESKHIDAKDADQILERWASQSLRVCFAVCLGDVAWHVHWVGTIRNAGPGRWILNAGNTTNMLSTGQYREIILTEDEELLGIRLATAGNRKNLEGFACECYRAVQQLNGELGLK